jgi:hypothetical protein
MPLSTSASENLNSTRALAVLLSLLVLYCGILEIVTRKGFTRVSQIQRRIDSDRQTAVHLQTTTPAGAKTALLIGNSLLIQGVQPTKLHQEMAPAYSSSVLGVENTQYLDWYFGLRRLFSEGSRPAAVILFLTPRQLISQGIDGEYFAHYMMQERDIVQVKRAARLETTMASNFFFANGSAWLGSRSMIRNWLLGELMPSVEQLTAYLPEKASSLPADDLLVQQSLKRLEGIRELCRDNGSIFIFVTPPLRDPSDVPDTLRTAAQNESITFLIPFRGGELPATYFSDGFHLNPRGAAVFTEKLGLELLEPLRHE